ncbi:hypothetical protein STW0522RAO56_24360 [Raoultella planticola]|nr:hypothetical protein STW0522RAO56_24360 [Raoultella planticola]
MIIVSKITGVNDFFGKCISMRTPHGDIYIKAGDVFNLINVIERRFKIKMEISDFLGADIKLKKEEYSFILHSIKIKGVYITGVIMHDGFVYPLAGGYYESQLLKCDNNDSLPTES